MTCELLKYIYFQGTGLPFRGSEDESMSFRLRYILCLLSLSILFLWYYTNKTPREGSIEAGALDGVVTPGNVDNSAPFIFIG